MNESLLYYILFELQLSKSYYKLIILALLQSFFHHTGKVEKDMLHDLFNSMSDCLR